MTTFVIGDTHGEPERLESPAIYQAFKTYRDGGEENLVVVGDFGMVWHDMRGTRVKMPPGEYYSLRHMSKLPWRVLFVDGNHENHERLAKFPEIDFGKSKAGDVMDGRVLHLKRGRIYTIEGRTFWCFGGGQSVDKEYRIQSWLATGKMSWWAEEIPSKEEFDLGLASLESVGWSVDYVLTHEAPASVKDKVLDTSGFPTSPVEQYLDGVLARLKYRKWFCGHYHRDEYLEQERIRFLYYNAAKVD